MLLIHKEGGHTYFTTNIGQKERSVDLTVGEAIDM